MKTMIILIFFISSHFNIFGQSTSNELGEKIFLAFKNDSFANIENCRLRQGELASFTIAHGYDTTSSDFLRYRSKYLEITKKFFDRCRLTRDRFPWKEAELTGIFLKDQNGTILPDETKTSPLILEIRARSGDKPITLVFDTFIGPDKLWKIGNSISSTEGMANNTD